MLLTPIKIGSPIRKKLSNSSNRLQKAILKRSKIRREIFVRNRTLQKREMGKKARMARESILEGIQSVGRKGFSGLKKMLGSGMDPLSSILEFTLTTLVGWALNNLPQIIEAIENFIKRAKKFFKSFKSLLGNIASWTGNLRTVISETLENWKKFDFNDSEGNVKKAMDDLNASFESMKNDLKSMEGALINDIETLEQGGSIDPAELSGDALNQTKQLLRNSEGFRTDAYWDVNAYRVGYGSDTVTDEEGNVTAVTANTVVTQEQAELDLERRIRTEFMPGVANQIGANWSKLPASAQAALTSVGYNYGSLPSGVVSASKSGNLKSIADSVEALKRDNGGINARRRMEEAEIIRGSGDGNMRRNSKQSSAYATAVNIGRQLESQGYRAWQHPDFNVDTGYTGSGRERVMMRSNNSYHNYGEALDYPLSHNSKEKLDVLYNYFNANRSKFGIAELLWQVKDHYDHLHVSFKQSPNVDRINTSTPDLQVSRRRKKIYVYSSAPKPSSGSNTSSSTIVVGGGMSLNRFMNNHLLLELAYT